MSARHEQLFQRYVAELADAKTTAEGWWSKLRIAESRRHTEPQATDTALARRWRVGPAAHPAVIAVVREYWNACEEINRVEAEAPEADDEGFVTPIDFLCEFLLDGRNDDLAEFLSNLTYWPVEDAPGEEETRSDDVSDRLTVATTTDDGWRDRAAALMEAVRDVAAPQAAPKAVETKGHHELFATYRQELRLARAVEVAYWEGLVSAAEADVGDRDLALEEVRERRPAGAVGFPKVVTAVRRIWLECVALNDALSHFQRVEPEQLALGWLIRHGELDLAAFLSDLPYWPMGLNRAGRWV